LFPTGDCDRFLVSLQVADFPSLLVLDATLVHPPSGHGLPSAMLNTYHFVREEAIAAKIVKNRATLDQILQFFCQHLHQSIG
jgi:hypothetical protein